MNRLLGMLTFVAMLAVNAALIMRDVVPAWTAGAPPIVTVEQLEPGWTRTAYLGIYGPDGDSLGGVWSETWRIGDTLFIESMTVLDEFKLNGETLTPNLRIDLRLAYNEEGLLEELDLDVVGLGMTIGVRGEYLPPDEFTCDWTFDQRQGTFILPAEATRALGDARQPFQGLGDLRVGQTWRHETLDPLAMLLPGIQGQGMEPRPMIVQVTGEEKIEHQGISVRAKVLEAERVRAWISPLGEVLRQELTLPAFGRITLQGEPFDDNARARARRSVVDVR